MKMLRLWAFGFVGYFYTAFVLQMLWNWFAAPALRLDPNRLLADVRASYAHGDGTPAECL